MMSANIAARWCRPSPPIWGSASRPAACAFLGAQTIWPGNCTVQYVDTPPAGQRGVVVHSAGSGGRPPCRRLSPLHPPRLPRSTTPHTPAGGGPAPHSPPHPQLPLPQTRCSGRGGRPCAPPERKNRQRPPPGRGGWRAAWGVALVLALSPPFHPTLSLVPLPASPIPLSNPRARAPPQRGATTGGPRRGGRQYVAAARPPPQLTPAPAPPPACPPLHNDVIAQHATHPLTPPARNTDVFRDTALACTAQRPWHGKHGGGHTALVEAGRRCLRAGSGGVGTHPCCDLLVALHARLRNTS